MSVHRFPHVAIVGARDRDLEALLSSGGLRVSSVPLADLASLAHPTARAPQVLVVDLRGESQLPQSLAALKRYQPGVGVVLVAGALDPALMLEAMRAGITECVAEPLTQADLQAAIARLSQQSAAPSVGGQVFAIMGAKGGVGATTVSVNVATELARIAPDQTLLVDMHLTGGDAAVFFGVEPRFSIVDALENSHRLDEAFFRGLVSHSEAGPHLLATSDRPFAGGATSERVRSLVDFAAHLYRYLILDVPRGDHAMVESLDGVSRIVVVANHELPTLRSACRLVPDLQQRYGKDRVSVVVNRLDRQSEITREDIERVVGMSVRHALPNDYRSALRSLNRGRPVSVDNHSKLAAAMKGLAQDLSGAVADGTDDGTGNGRFFGLFSGRRS
jgi:pilus assembly protein CpaE